MSKKILILEGSPRKNGNTDLMAQEFAVGATEAGHKVEKSISKIKQSKVVLAVVPVREMEEAAYRKMI